MGIKYFFSSLVYATMSFLLATEFSKALPLTSAEFCLARVALELGTLTSAEFCFARMRSVIFRGRAVVSFYFPPE